VHINLGDLAKDTVTGFEGICVARTEWLNGCVRVSLQPQKVGKDNKPAEIQAFDQEQLVVVKAGKVPSFESTMVERPRARTGGPMPDPVRRRDVGGRR
jgi:hypothetical protein